MAEDRKAELVVIGKKLGDIIDQHSVLLGTKDGRSKGKAALAGDHIRGAIEFVNKEYERVQEGRKA